MREENQVSRENHMCASLRRCAVRFLLFSLLVAICGMADASQEYGLFVPGKATKPVLYFADRAIEAGDPCAEYAVVLVHGYPGGTNDYTRNIRSSLESCYPDAAGRILYVAPCFLSDTLNSPLNATYAFWHGGSWAQGDDSPISPLLSSYDVMDAILGILADNDKYPCLKHVFISGFSAGGQYVIRYVCVGSFPKRMGVQYDFAPGSPSSWLYLDNERVKPDGTLGPFRDEYPGYDDWKYGLQHRNRYADSVSLETIVDNVSSRRVLCFCGTDDDNPEYDGLDVSTGAMAQGSTRYRRYLNYRKYASARQEWFVNFQFVEVPNVAHAPGSCYADRRILDFAMGHAVGWDRDPKGNRIKMRYVDASIELEGDGLTENSAIRSLRNAVAQAEDGDQIVLSEGIYPPINTKGKRIVVKGNVIGGAVVIDGGASNRCIYVGSLDVCTNSVFSNLTLRNGWSGNGGGAYGGMFDHCTFIGNVATNSGGGAYGCVLSDCYVQSNSAKYGAGLSSGTARRTIFVGNQSSASGAGALKSYLYESIIEGNRATGASAGGGGCYECTNEDCVIQGNYAGSSGGGAYRGVYTRCEFNENVAASTGGGTYDCLLTDCLVVSNSANYAGGLSRGRASRTRIINNVSNRSAGGAQRSVLHDTLIVGNRAIGNDSYGGGCYECTNINCTVYSNFSGAKGGGAYSGVLTNCIVWGNSSGNGYVDMYKCAQCGYCLSGTVLDGVGNMTGDPKMNAPARGDFRLRSDSPCLNAGWNGAVVGLTDVLGHSRIQNGVVDIGACEGVAQSTLSTEVEVPYWWLDQYPTLLKTYGGDYELAAKAKTGKRNSADGEMCVWEDYVVGTDPTKSNDLFTAYIDVGDDGKISISYLPRFEDEGERALRKYTMLGKKNLHDGSWREVPEGRESEYNFFKVKVEMR